MLEDRIKRLNILGVSPALRAFATIADCPTQVPCIRLVPPAVALRQIEAAIDQDLYATRPACFPRPARGVDPDIDALHQLLGERDVIVLEEYDAPAELGLLSNLDPVADHSLSLNVSRMGLAGEDELNRPYRVVQKAR